MRIRKKINFLNKKKLIWKGEKKDFTIFLTRKKGEHPELNIEFSIKNYDDNENCLIYLEYYQGKTQYTYSKELGSLNELKSKNIVEQLENISYEQVLFEIKIIDKSNGRIIALASRIKPDFIDEENQDDKFSDEDYVKSTSLVRWREKDMEVPWYVYIEEGERPICFLNKKISLKQYLGTSNIHKTLIHPIIFREIIIKYINSSEIDKEDKWRKKFLDFAETIHGSPLPDNISNKNYSSEIDAWLEEVTEFYSKKMKHQGNQ